MSLSYAHQYGNSTVAAWVAARCAETILDMYDFDDEDTTLLDFACGPGLLAQELAPYCRRIVGVDMSQDMVDRFNESVTNQGLDPEEMLAVQKDELADDPEELDGELFDVVVCSQAYHHIPDVRQVTQALARRVRPGGALFILDIDKSSAFGERLASRPSRRTHSEAGSKVVHRGGFSPQELLDCLQSVDLLEDVQVEV